MRRKAGLALVALLIFVSPTFAGGGHGAHWGYEGDAGPEHWGHLSHDFEACGKGRSQSPIDITGAQDANIDAIRFEYKPTQVDIINNGHTIQLNYEPGSSVTIRGKKYSLLQLHFHTPSEHKIDGSPYPMEAHLVHKSDDGELAVVGVMMEKGEKNRFIQVLWNNLPSGPGEKSKASIKVNAIDFLPADRSYYHYTGSLTTPPCSEGVNWNVLQAAVEVSDEQVEKFASFFPSNARPTQSTHGRGIQASP